FGSNKLLSIIRPALLSVFKLNIYLSLVTPPDHILILSKGNRFLPPTSIPSTFLLNLSLSLSVIKLPASALYFVSCNSFVVYIDSANGIPTVTSFNSAFPSFLNCSQLNESAILTLYRLPPTKTLSVPSSYSAFCSMSTNLYAKFFGLRNS